VIQDGIATGSFLWVGSHPGVHGRFGEGGVPASLTGTKYTVPDTSNAREGVVAAFVPFVMPVMMVRHLCIWKPSLQRVRHIEPTTHT